MPRQARKPVRISSKRECGRIIIFEGSEVTKILRPGDDFRGSHIVPSGRCAVCNTCGTKHAIGLRCLKCIKAKDDARREHKNTPKAEVKPI